MAAPPPPTSESHLLITRSSRSGRCGAGCILCRPSGAGGRPGDVIRADYPLCFERCSLVVLIQFRSAQCSGLISSQPPPTSAPHLSPAQSTRRGRFIVAAAQLDGEQIEHTHNRRPTDPPHLQGVKANRQQAQEQQGIPAAEDQDIETVD